MKGQFKINLKNRTSGSMAEALGLTQSQSSAMARVLLVKGAEALKMTDVIEAMAEEAETLEQLLYGVAQLGLSQVPSASVPRFELTVTPDAETINEAFGITEQRFEELRETLIKASATTGTVADSMVRITEFTDNPNELAVMFYLLGGTIAKLQGLQETLQGADSTLEAVKRIISDSK